MSSLKVEVLHREIFYNGTRIYGSDWVRVARVSSARCGRRRSDFPVGRCNAQPQ